jgi:hypothetical protein
MSRSALLTLATALVLAAVAPVHAFAVTPLMDPASGKFPVSALGTSGGGELRVTGQESAVRCGKVVAAGKITSATTGEASASFGECSTAGTACTTSGQASGTITLANQVTHLVYLDENHTKVGTLATPPAGGVFAKFTCFFGLVSVEVKGNGLLAEVTSPKCGATSTTATAVANATGPVQQYQQVEETGTVYHLSASVNGGPFEEAALSAGLSGTASENVTLTCPEQK